MAKITPITEHFQHFRSELKDSFWGDLYDRSQQAWKQLWEAEWERQRDRYSGWGQYERGGRQGRDYRNGYYERDFVTRLGIIRLRIARTRKQNFLPPGLETHPGTRVFERKISVT
jgi:putative transposase